MLFRSSSFVASLYGHDSLRLDKMVKQMGDAFASVLRLWIDAHTDPSIKIESKYKMSEGSFVRLKELLQAKAARQATDIYDYIGRGFITGLRSILASAGTIETSFKQQYHRRPAQWEFTQLLSQIIEFHKRMATSSFQFFLKYTSESMLPQIFGATCYPGLFEVVRTKGRYYWQLTERFRKALAATAEALERAESDDDQIDYITGCPITYARSINCEGSSRNVLSEFMEWIITSMQILYICDLPRRAFREKKS